MVQDVYFSLHTVLDSPILSVCIAAKIKTVHGVCDTI